MPKIVTPLTDALIKNLKPKEKAYVKTDGQGLRLLVKSNGIKLWEFEYTSPTLQKRRKTSFGNYPQTTLVTARKRRDDCINDIRNGIDPIAQKHTATKMAKENNEIKQNTFKNVATEWHNNYKRDVTESYHNKLLRLMELHIFPYVGSKPITEVERKDLIGILKDLKEKEILETADRVFILLNRIYKYAVTVEKTPHNIIADIDKKIILGKKRIIHYPTFIKEKDIKGLLLSIDEYQGELSTKYAMKLLPYIFVRSSNIRNMMWDEIDFKKQEWTIPASKMKTKKEFVLPLSDQAISILGELKKYEIDGPLVFPGIRSLNRPISDNTLISALRRMGYTKEEIVPHSFRSIFSTIAYENIDKHNFSGEVIEALLAHQETNKVKEAYNRATYREPMRKLIQWYADYLDRVKYA